MLNELIILFSRAPVLGKVKRRLSKEIGDNAALLVHQKFFNRTMEVIRQSGYEHRIYLSETPNMFDLDYTLQHGTDLGERMSFAMQHELTTNMRVCLIGSDCIDISVNDLKEAFESLENNELVLGPAYDGGYYLIGLKKFIPELFKGITWGTNTVLNETLDIARTLNLKIKLLAKRSDADQLSDLPANWEAL